MPQNHPKPNEAVSNFAGAALSMGGRLFVVSIAAAVPAIETVSIVMSIMSVVALYGLCRYLCGMVVILILGQYFKISTILTAVTKANAPLHTSHKCSCPNAHKHEPYGYLG